MSAEPSQTIEDSVAGATPNGRRQHKLSELLARCDPNLPLREEEQDWLDAPAVGLEEGATAAVRP